jgi:hypothetical protein
MDNKDIIQHPENYKCGELLFYLLDHNNIDDDLKLRIITRHIGYLHGKNEGYALPCILVSLAMDIIKKHKE